MVPPLIGLVRWDLDSQEARRNQVQSTSERSRAAWLEGIAGSTKKTRKRALLFGILALARACLSLAGGWGLDGWFSELLKPKEK